jgi:hypothetical protein
MASRRVKLLVLLLGWAALIGIQLGLPLELGDSDPSARRYIAPIQPDGCGCRQVVSSRQKHARMLPTTYTPSMRSPCSFPTFPVIWGVIFCVQGLGTLAPWVVRSGATEPFWTAVWPLWLPAWLAENVWSITQVRYISDMCSWYAHKLRADDLDDS